MVALCSNLKKLQQHFGEAIAYSRNAAKALDLESRSLWQAKAHQAHNEAKVVIRLMESELRQARRFSLATSKGKPIQINLDQEYVSLTRGEVSFDHRDHGGKWPAFVVSDDDNNAKVYPLHLISGIQGG